MLMKSSTQSLTEQLSARISERIRNRLLAPGARLPSVRQCAQQNGVSPSTVVAAYDQLLAQGLVEARKNRGFFVRESGRSPGALDLPAAAQQVRCRRTQLLHGACQLGTVNAAAAGRRFPASGREVGRVGHRQIEASRRRQLSAVPQVAG